MTAITVVLDLDGTLVDSAPDLAEAVNRMLAARRAAPLEVDDVRAFIGGGAVKLLQRAFAARRLPVEGADDIGALYDEFRATYDPIAARTTRPYPFVLPTLDKLRAAGHLLAVCTNKPEGPSRILLDTLFLSERLDAGVFGDSLPTRKPDAAPILAAVHAAGGVPDRAVMVGDSDADVKGARAAGIPAIAVAWGYGGSASALGADLVIERFDQLPHAVADALGVGPLPGDTAALSPERSVRE